MQGTRMYSKDGKRYKSKTEKYIGQQLTRLANAVARVEPLYDARKDVFERNFRITQQQLNMASVNKPSIYTKDEVKLFYRVTQKIWQQEGVGEHDRNEAILDHFNSIRRENNLSPITLTEIVQYVLDANKRFKGMQNVNPEEYMDDEEKKAFDEAQRADNSDAPVGSPPGIGQKVVNDIQDALEDLFILPDPLAI